MQKRSVSVFHGVALLAIVLSLVCIDRTAAGELIVSAASSLTNVMEEAARVFEKENPDVRVLCNFGASGSLVQQMRHGAPVDLFASASRTYMDRSGDLGLVDGLSRIDFAANELVLAVHRSGAGTVDGLSDLTSSVVTRVGLGNPGLVPAGSYAKNVLESAGLWDRLQEKFIYGNSVRQVLDYLSRGEIDAAFVYASDARLREGSVRVAAVLSVPGSKIIYPAALVNASKNKQDGARFLVFLVSETGQRLFAGYGFSKL